VDVPSWDALRLDLERRVVDLGGGGDLVWMREDQDAHGRLYPPCTRDGTLRLFGKAEEDVRVTLYRDPAYWCPYCERVQMQLEVKRVPYRIRMINMRCYGKKPDYYTRMVPSGLLPAVEVDGRLFTESVDIMFLLEDQFTEHSLADFPDFAQKARTFMKLERECFSWWCTFVFRPPDRRARVAWEDVLSRWDAAVQSAGGPYLFGNRVSVIDIMAVPFFERYVASSFYWQGFRIRGTGQFPGIDSWMTAMEREIPSFAAMKADFYSTIKDLPPQMGRPFFSDTSQDFRAFVEGDGEIWKLPLPPIGPSSLEPITSLAEGDDGVGLEHHLEACARMIQNHSRIARFALRGAGDRPRTVTAPLSDPDAIPDSSLHEEMDVVLRLLSQSLLQQRIPEREIQGVVSCLTKDERDGIFKSISYFRDRVGVPRDMMFPAARILRAFAGAFADQFKS